MGCTSSKQARRDLVEAARHPYPRSYSLPYLRTRKRLAAGGSSRQHDVSLTSSTLGSLRLDPYEDEDALLEEHPPAVAEDDDGEAMKKPLNDGRRRWAEVRPKSPLATPTSEPEVINTWELMEGLDDDGLVMLPATPAVGRSLSLPAASPPPEAASEAAERVKVVINDQNSIAEERNGSGPKMSLVKARIHAFQEKINARRAMMNAAKVAAFASQLGKYPPRGEGKVVLYLTSLRGVRKTYEDCSEILVILRGYGVRIDERDMSMHSGFKEELQGILGVVPGGLRLPRVFADGRYLGGAEEIRQAHETGALLEALRGCVAPISVKGVAAACVACGDVRFVPCKVCSGSCKVFVEGDVETEKQHGEETGAIGFRRCLECNENGLVRCPMCCAD